MAHRRNPDTDIHKPRWRISWYDLQDSLWFRPTVMTIAAIVMYLLTTWLDKTLLADHDFSVWWMFDGGSEGARGVLSAIASTIMTVATTAFSITLVVLQLNSGQYSPRILRSFTGDPVNQTVLGIFIATFVYSLLVLRSVRSQAEDFDAFVPTISVTIALLMTLLSMGALIYFFHHSTRTIQASVIIDRTASDTIEAIEKAITSREDDTITVMQADEPLPDEAAMLGDVQVREPGYVQDPNLDKLVRLAGQHNVLIQVHPQVGDYVFLNAKLATIWAYPDHDPEQAHEKDAASDLDSLVEEVSDRIEIGIERTLEEGVLFGVQQLADISLRAMSTGVNDPTTAIDTLNRMGDVLIRFDEIAGHDMRLHDDDGTLRVIMPIASFEEAARIAFDQMRYASANDPVVIGYMFTIMNAIGHNLSDSARKSLHGIGEEMLASVRAADHIPSDLARIEFNARWVVDDLPSEPQEPRRIGRPVRTPVTEEPTASAT